MSMYLPTIDPPTYDRWGEEAEHEREAEEDSAAMRRILEASGWTAEGPSYVRDDYGVVIEDLDFRLERFTDRWTPARAHGTEVEGRGPAELARLLECDLERIPYEWRKGGVAVEVAWADEGDRRYHEMRDELIDAGF